jgi:murein DD-endopeptidase MepM/ murein hydrolase activator NlpD
MRNKTTLRLPFISEWFVLNGGDKYDLNHHHGVKAQNYAFDFTVLGKDSKSHKESGKRNEDYFAFGSPVLSPADGIIVEAVDGVRDNLPGHGNYLAGAGNYVVIKHSDNEYSFLAHLRHGSVAVKAGEGVKIGDKIGRCGNSGTSFAPHLHYHLQNSYTLVTYNAEYDPGDLTKGNFPIKIDVSENATGIKVYFSDVLVNNKLSKTSYSPQRGQLVKSART